VSMRPDSASTWLLCSIQCEVHTPFWQLAKCHHVAVPNTTTSIASAGQHSNQSSGCVFLLLGPPNTPVMRTDNTQGAAANHQA
jgi:hypothetical protein